MGLGISINGISQHQTTLLYLSITRRVCQGSLLNSAYCISSFDLWGCKPRAVLTVVPVGESGQVFSKLCIPFYTKTTGSRGKHLSPARCYFAEEGQKPGLLRHHTPSAPRNIEALLATTYC
jgi:hypothetical protein